MRGLGRAFNRECGLDSEFVNGLDHHAEVMTKHLTKRFVDLRRERPTAQALTELRLDHVKGRFHVGSLVIVL